MYNYYDFPFNKFQEDAREIQRTGKEADFIKKLNKS